MIGKIFGNGHFDRGWKGKFASPHVLRRNLGAVVQAQTASS
jgi:hypothetical protein